MSTTQNRASELVLQKAVDEQLLNEVRRARLFQNVSINVNNCLIPYSRDLNRDLNVAKLACQVPGSLSG